MKTAKDIMSGNLLTASVNDTLEKAHQLMEEKQTHHILITDQNQRLAGLLSDRDIKKFASPFAGSDLETSKDKATLSLPVERIMSKNPVTIGHQKSVKACIEKMLENSIHSLPVLDDDKKLLGIVTSTDIFKYFLTLISKGAWSKDPDF